MQTETPTLSKAQARFGAIAKGDDTSPRAAQTVDVASAATVSELEVVKPQVAAAKRAFPKLEEVDPSSGMISRPEMPPHDDLAVREKLKKDIAAMMKR